MTNIVRKIAGNDMTNMTSASHSLNTAETRSRSCAAAVSVANDGFLYGHEALPLFTATPKNPAARC
jgi:hypothetical protein